MTDETRIRVDAGSGGELAARERAGSGESAGEVSAVPVSLRVGLIGNVDAGARRGDGASCGTRWARRAPRRGPRALGLAGRFDARARAGKSTLVGVLTRCQLDDGRGSARSNVFIHKHERETGRTSSIDIELLVRRFERPPRSARLAPRPRPPGGFRRRFERRRGPN